MADPRPCARYWGSDGTLCSTHHGRFAGDSENRCDARASRSEPCPHGFIGEPCEIHRHLWADPFAARPEPGANLAGLLDAIIHDIERGGEAATVPAIADRLALAGVRLAALPASPEDGLDVERLARALRVHGDQQDDRESYGWHCDMDDCAPAIAHEYAALKEPTP